MFSRLTSQEVAELRALFRIEPIGYERLDHYLSVMIAMHGKKAKPQDFNLSHYEPDMDEDPDGYVLRTLAKFGR